MSMIDSSELVTCPDCGAMFDDDEMFCPGCDRPRTRTEQNMRRFSRLTGEDYDLVLAYTKEHGLRELTLDQRHHQLELAIRTMVVYRFQLVSQTDTTATFLAPKEAMGCAILAIGVLTFGLLILVWIVSQQGKSSDPVHIEVDQFGEIFVTGRAGYDVRSQIRRLNEA